MISREEKPWGMSYFVDKSEKSLIYLCEVKKGGYCSLHKHIHHTNTFMVLSGWVRIITSDNNGMQCYEMNVKDCGAYFISINAEIPHQFQVLRSGVMLETYYRKDGERPEENDIQRFSEGGFLPSLCEKTPIQVLASNRDLLKVCRCLENI